MNIKFLKEDAILPKYSTESAACFDIFYAKGVKLEDWKKVNTLEIIKETENGCVYSEFITGWTCTIETGLGFEIPRGYGMFVYSRSGHGFNQNTFLANSVGVIDADYRGELKVKLMTIDAPFEIEPKKAIAQACLVEVPKVRFDLVKDLTETSRGTGGFGSTDKKV